MGTRSRPLQARSRAVCLGALGGVLAAQLALGLWLDGPGLLLRFEDARELLAAAQARDEPVDVLVIGSSKLGFALDAPELEERLSAALGDAAPQVLKATLPAGDAIAHDWLGPRLAERGVRPRLAIVEISPESFPPYNRWLNFHITRQFTWGDLAVFLPDIVRRGAFSRVLATRLTPFFRYRYELLRALAGSPPPYLTAARPAPEPAPPDPEAERRRRLAATQDDVRGIRRWLRDYRIGGSTTEAFERVLERLRASGAAIVLVQPAVTRTYAGLYDDAIEARYAEHVLELITRHEASYVDLRDRLPDTDFIDSHHASDAGRIAFTQLFADEVLLPAWERLRD